MKITFTQALQHLKIGAKVTRLDGTEGEVVALTERGVDVKFVSPGAEIINHYDDTYFDELDVEPSEVDDPAEFERKHDICAASRDDLVTALMDEIEELRSRMIILELALTQS